MNLALADIRHRLSRFAATSIGVGLLFTVVLAMVGIHGGLVDDATMLQRVLNSDLWVVQRNSHGPFADQSRLDQSLVDRAASVEGVARARAVTYQVVQRDVDERELRFALVGIDWPRDDARGFSVVAGRNLAQAAGELVVDASLGLDVGAIVALAGERFCVVGVTRQLLATAGEGVVVATLSDAQRILEYSVSDVRVMERAGRVERLRRSGLDRIYPTLGALLADPAFVPPGAAHSTINAVLINVNPGHSVQEVRQRLAAWNDVSVLTNQDQETALLEGTVDKAKRQLALFGLVLILTASILIAALIYTATVDKAHDIALLKLMGASRPRIAGMVLQQAWLMAAIGYACAVGLGSVAFPHFPRRIVLSDSSTILVGVLVLTVSTLAALAGVAFALRLDAARALDNS
jgi:putative ABC transport system permease protein